VLAVQVEPKTNATIPVDTPQLSAGFSDLAPSSSNPNIQHFPRKEPGSRPGGKTPLIASGLHAPWSNLDLAQALGVTGGVDLAQGTTPGAGLKANPSAMRVTGAAKDGSGNRRGSQSSADFAAAMAAVREWRKESAKYRAGLIAESPILSAAMAQGETRRLTCLFCGLLGHTVAECSETPRSELPRLEALATQWGGGNAGPERGGGARVVEMRCLLCERRGHWGVDCSPSFRDARERDNEGGNAAVRNGADVTRKRSRDVGRNRGAGDGKQGRGGTVSQSPESLDKAGRNVPSKGLGGAGAKRREEKLHQEEADGRVYGVNAHLDRSESGRKSKSTRNSGSGKESMSRREGGASGAGYEGSKERSKRSSHSAYKTSSGAKGGELRRVRSEAVLGRECVNNLPRTDRERKGKGDGDLRGKSVSDAKEREERNTGRSPQGGRMGVLDGPRSGGRKEQETVPPAELRDALEGARLPRRDLMRWSEEENFEKRVEGFLVRVRFGR
jgi:hypothetical protein